MRRLLIIIVSLTALMAVLLGASRLIGQTFPADRTSTLVLSQNCSQPCWHGISPHLTSLREAVDIIQADHMLHMTEMDNIHLCWSSSNGPFASGCANTFRSFGTNNDTIEVISLVPRPDNFLLGDAMNFFGEPITAAYPCKQEKGNVYFDASAFVTTPLTPRYLSPVTVIIGLSYVGRQNLWYSPHAPRWPGFRAPDTPPAC